MKKCLVVVVFAVFGFPLWTHAENVKEIAFPVQSTEVSFDDTYTAPRSGGRIHHATDIMGKKMTPVVAATDGVILFAPMEEPSYGYMIMLGGDDGYQYNYVHLNNDTPGTDDGIGGPEHAYAPGIAKGVRVTRGQVIGYLGDSGNAEATDDHVHFEMLDPNEIVVNPYPYLVAAFEQFRMTFSAASEEREENQITISENLVLEKSEGDVACEAELLMRSVTQSSVYYCGVDGKRYVFQDAGTYFSWFDDFDAVKIISDADMSEIPFGGVVTYAPGTMIKMPSVPKVYRVGENGTLHWIPDESTAIQLYGTAWSTRVHDLPESFYPAYQLGSDWESESS
jgi:hypothetical protein